MTGPVNGEQVAKRRVFEAVTPAGGKCSVVVARFGWGLESEVWLSFHGATETTARMTRQAADELGDALKEAAA